MLERRLGACGLAAGLALAGAAAHAAQPSNASERDCLARAMYFESEKSAEDGMLAVGTVVANRLKSGRYGETLCRVVGQPRQFAPGVLSRRMDGPAAERARRVADAVLGGKRHPGAREAMFFHTAGLRFGYDNMHYVLVSGGNAFYEKRPAATAAAARANAVSLARAYASATTDKAAAAPVVAAAMSRSLGQMATVTTTIVPAPQAAPVLQRVAEVTPLPPVAKSTVPRPPVRPLPPAGFELASAYAGRPAASGGALAAVAALEPKARPRVVAITAPVQAAAIPSPPVRPAGAPSRLANIVVAQAWSAFE